MFLLRTFDTIQAVAVVNQRQWLAGGWLDRWFGTLPASQFGRWKG
jgi:hypothetical protein